MKVKYDHHSKFSNLSNWKEEAWKKSENLFNYCFIIFASMYCKLMPCYHIKSTSLLSTYRKRNCLIWSPARTLIFLRIDRIRLCHAKIVHVTLPQWMSYMYLRLHKNGVNSWKHVTAITDHACKTVPICKTGRKTIQNSNLCSIGNHLIR